MDKPGKIKIALVDDHTLLRDGIAMMLQQVDDIQIVGSFSSGEEIVDQFSAVGADVILMDIMMKQMTGIEATRWIKERDKSVKIIILSSEIKKEFVTAGIQSGIDGYLPKNVERETLIKAIRTVLKGEKFFNEAITSLVFEDYYNKEKTSRQVQNQIKMSDLSKRESEVLALIASGKSTKEVAEQLFISTKTVDTHKMHILDKLGLKNTAELVKYAIKNNLISI
ncbi:DNA-binding response regulator [Cytophagales bacterium WSM2-2]|nr:DNA-binding response regulator [Cytophagales bacterium WSM2-2]